MWCNNRGMYTQICRMKIEASMIEVKVCGAKFEGFALEIEVWM